MAFNFGNNDFRYIFFSMFKMRYSYYLSCWLSKFYFFLLQALLESVETLGFISNVSLTAIEVSEIAVQGFDVIVVVAKVAAWEWLGEPRNAFTLYLTFLLLHALNMTKLHNTRLRLTTNRKLLDDFTKLDFEENLELYLSSQVRSYSFNWG